jgi:hypothetical protein
VWLVMDHIGVRWGLGGRLWKMDVGGERGGGRSQSWAMPCVCGRNLADVNQTLPEPRQAWLRGGGRRILPDESSKSRATCGPVPALLGLAVRLALPPAAASHTQPLWLSSVRHAIA